MIVEDGTGLAEANAYASEDALETYADDNGVTLATGDAEAALVRASTAIDALFGTRFPGTKVNGRDQGLAWPRSGGYDANGDAIADDAVPAEIVKATCEAAIRELVSPGSMMPDQKRGGAIKRVDAKGVSVEWFGNAPAATTFSKIEGILAPLLGSPSQFTARAVRA